MEKPEELTQEFTKETLDETTIGENKLNKTDLGRYMQSGDEKYVKFMKKIDINKKVESQLVDQKAGEWKLEDLQD